MKKYRFFEILAFITVLSLTVLAGISCSKPSPGNQELSGVTWVLKSFGDTAGNPTKAIAGHEPTLTFDKETMKIGGNGGVNGYSGDYAVTGDKITVSGIIQTEMAAANPALNNQEIAFMKILQSAQSFNINGQELTITGSEGILIFLTK